MFGICGVDESCGSWSEFSWITTSSFATWIEDRCGVGSPPGVVLVYVCITVARRLDVVRAEALVAYQGLHTLTTDVNLIAGVHAGAVRAADSAAL